MIRHIAIFIGLSVMLLGATLSWADRQRPNPPAIGSTTLYSVIPMQRWQPPILSQASIRPVLRKSATTWYQTTLTHVPPAYSSPVALGNTGSAQVAAYFAADGTLLAAESLTPLPREQSKGWTIRELHRTKAQNYAGQLSMVGLDDGTVGLAWTGGYKHSLNFTTWTPAKSGLVNRTIESEVPGYPMQAGVLGADRGSQPFVAYVSQYEFGQVAAPTDGFRMRFAALDPYSRTGNWIAVDLKEYSIGRALSADDPNAAAQMLLANAGIVGASRTNNGPMLAWTRPYDGRVIVALARGWDVLDPASWLIHESPLLGLVQLAEEVNIHSYTSNGAAFQSSLRIGALCDDGTSLRLAQSQVDIPGGPSDWSSYALDSTTGSETLRLVPSSSRYGLDALYYYYGDTLKRASASSELPLRPQDWQITGIPHAARFAATQDSRQVMTFDQYGLISLRW